MIPVTVAHSDLFVILTNGCPFSMSALPPSIDSTATFEPSLSECLFAITSARLSCLIGGGGEPRGAAGGGGFSTFGAGLGPRALLFPRCFLRPFVHRFCPLICSDLFTPFCHPKYFPPIFLSSDLVSSDLFLRFVFCEQPSPGKIPPVTQPLGSGFPMQIIVMMTKVNDLGAVGLESMLTMSFVSSVLYTFV